jgi:predicted ATPase
VGKTRLALEIGRRLVDDFAHGAGWVALAPVQSDDDLAAAVAAALAISPGPTQTPAEAVRGYLASHALLLILDNFEHLLAVALQISTWLQIAPQLKILATSRVALDLYGEYELAVAPLALPNLAHLPPPAELAQVPAVKLFAERTGAVDLGFRLNAENALAVAGLCVALDGLPLAIELAAARSRSLTPQDLLQQIVAARQQHQPAGTLLAQSKRGVDERHRTLHEAIDWSYRLLAPMDQVVFAQLGVFVGGCTLAAAAAISGAADENVQGLLQANLVQLEQENASGPATETRLALLETLRTFAVEQLVAQEELSAAQIRHAGYFAAYAQEIFAGLLDEEQSLWMQRALRDHDNLRAALRFALHEQLGESAVAIAGGLWWFWNRQGLLREGSAWLEASLNCPPQEDPPNDRYRQQRARALNGAGSLATEQGDFDAALRYHQEGLALRRALGDQAGAADILHNLALTARCQGDFTQALQWFEESLGEMVKLGHAPESDVMNYTNIGITHFEMGNLALAQPWLETALVSARSQNDGWRAAFVAANLADLLLAQGDLSRAEGLAQESVQDFKRFGDQLYLAEALLVLARVTVRRGERQQAHELCHTVFDIYRGIDDRHGIANVLQVQAWLALADPDQPQGRDHARALFEQACSLRTAVPRAIAPYEQAEYENLRRALCAPTTI